MFKKNLCDTFYDDLPYFYEFIENNKIKLIELFGIEFIVQQGTLKICESHLDYIYLSALNDLPNELLINITYNNYDCEKDYTLEKPNIIPNIDCICFEHIFRYLGTDNIFHMKKTNHVSDWGGQILPENTKFLLDIDDCVRIPIYESNKCYYALYFDLLKKINEFKFLAINRQLYSSQHEHVLLIIDIRCISEIPSGPGWQKNENLNKFIDDFNSNNQKKSGYCFTGVGAIDSEKSEESNIYFDSKLYSSIFDI